MGSVPPVQFPELRDPEWLAYRIGQGLTSAAIAAELGCSVALVSQHVAAHGLTGVRARRVYETAPLVSDPEWLEARIREGLSQPAIARLAGVSQPTVRNWERRFGFGELHAEMLRFHRELRKQRRAEEHAERKFRQQPLAVLGPDWLQAELFKGRTQQSIADELGLDKGTVSHFIRRYGLRGSREIGIAPIGKQPLIGPKLPKPLGQNRPFARLRPGWLQERLDAGHTAQSIARELGVTKQAVVYQIRKLNGGVAIPYTV